MPLPASFRESTPILPKAGLEIVATRSKRPAGNKFWHYEPVCPVTGISLSSHNISFSGHLFLIVI